MATQLAPDGNEYEYNPNDPADVARVAALCEPSFEEKRKRARAAFEAAEPEAAKNAALGVAIGAGGPTAADIQSMIAQAVAQAVAATRAQDVKPVDPGPSVLGASVEATTPVEGSQGNA